MGDGHSDTRFYVDQEGGHELLTKSSFWVMNGDLHFNMPSSFISNDDRSVVNFQRAFKLVLDYASQY